MVVVMVTTILAMILLFCGYLINRDFERREARISAKVEKLGEVASLRSDYKRKLAEQQRLAAEVRKNGSTRILSYLESMASKAAIDLANVSERRGEPTGSDQVREEAAAIEIREVSIDRLDRFLESIEAGNRLVKVRRLKVKKRFDNPELLDATVTVGTFKPPS